MRAHQIWETCQRRAFFADLSGPAESSLSGLMLEVAIRNLESQGMAHRAV